MSNSPSNKIMKAFGNQLQSLLDELQTKEKQAGENAFTEGPEAIESRAAFAFSYYRPYLSLIFDWLCHSSETANFSYSLTEFNLQYLAQWVSLITNCGVNTAKAYIDELLEDADLLNHIVANTSDPKEVTRLRKPLYGRRFGWYALVRAVRPRFVVETGVDKGLGSCILASALLRNAEEGAGGFYIGTDFNPAAGELFKGRYAEQGTIMYGDSLESLSKINHKIDFFINDSDHSADYEKREYQLMNRLFTHDAIILGDNAHATNELCNFAEKTGRKFAFFKEIPEEHWYPGAGIGAAWR